MQKTKPLTADITPEMIKAWKKEHGKVFFIKVDDKMIYLKKPGRKALSYASGVGTKDPMKFNEIILADCMLGGDIEMLNDDELFLAASAKVGDLIQFKEAELGEL